MLAVTVICTDPKHPVNRWVEAWKARESHRADIAIVRDVAEAAGGDFLFLVSCHQIVRAELRARYRHSLVLHASALPHGKGMSPHVWQILEGSNRFPVTLLNAEDALDSGDIWKQEFMDFDGTELFDAINLKVFTAELALMTWALDNCDVASPRKQVGEGTMYRRRKPEDSRIDPGASLSEVFNLLRVCDPDRFPAFFHMNGQRYKIRLERYEP